MDGHADYGSFHADYGSVLCESGHCRDLSEMSVDLLPGAKGRTSRVFDTTSNPLQKVRPQIVASLLYGRIPGYEGPDLGADPWHWWSSKVDQMGFTQLGAAAYGSHPKEWTQQWQGTEITYNRSKMSGHKDYSK